MLGCLEEQCLWQEELFPAPGCRDDHDSTNSGSWRIFAKAPAGAGGLFLSSFHMYNCLSGVSVRDITVVAKRLNHLHLTQVREILIVVPKTTLTGEGWSVLYFSEDRFKILTQRRNALSLFPSTAMASWSPDPWYSWGPELSECWHRVQVFALLLSDASHKVDPLS